MAGTLHLIGRGCCPKTLIPEGVKYSEPLRQTQSRPQAEQPPPPIRATPTRRRPNPTVETGARPPFDRPISGLPPQSGPSLMRDFGLPLTSNLEERMNQGKRQAPEQIINYLR